MTASELIIGEKYVPIDKTVLHYSSLEESNAYKAMQESGQDYLYYRGFDGVHHAFWVNMEDCACDYFNPTDISPYINSPVKISAIDYVLLNSPAPIKHSIRTILKKAAALWESQMMDAYNQGRADEKDGIDCSAKNYITKNYKP